MPLDPAPVEDGNLVVLDGIAIPRDAVSMNRLLPLFKSHFATCPNANQHRKGT